MSNEPELALKLELKLALEPLAAFGVTAVPPEPDRPPYTYSDLCPTTGARLTLPRSALAEAVARGLMARLAKAEEPQDREGKMYGVLVVQTAAGEVGVLKAFSGLLQGQAVQPGWVPPIPGREAVAGSEAETLAQLTAIGQELAQIAQDPAWQTLATLEQTYQARRHSLHHQHQQAKADRQHQRQQLQATVPEPQLGEALAALDRQSQQEGIQRRKLKQEQDAALAPLRAKTQDLADRRLALRRDRTRLSRQLQAQMHATYALTNFAGRSQSLLEIVQNQGIPTGTGECCAPKLLHFAASAGLRPLGLAVFWWERGEFGGVG
ncbi:MAG: RluA family pseudouridine synthase, partial [Prochlorothrix sp.]